jgi:hypothetical protein
MTAIWLMLEDDTIKINLSAFYQGRRSIKGKRNPELFVIENTEGCSTAF